MECPDCSNQMEFVTCPECNSPNIKFISFIEDLEQTHFKCMSCDNDWLHFGPWNGDPPPPGKV